MTKYDFNLYQDKAKTFLVNSGDDFKNDMAVLLGLLGESGEVAEKYKKIIRDKNSIINDEDKQALSKELGDVLWYLSVLADRLGLKLGDIADDNITKLTARKQKDTIQGDGDDR